MMIRFRRDLKGTFRFIFSILFILAIPIILSSLLSCRVSVEGEPHRQGPGPNSVGFHGIEGPWLYQCQQFYQVGLNSIGPETDYGPAESCSITVGQMG